jgi:hypothetical protein
LGEEYRSFSSSLCSFLCITSRTPLSSCYFPLSVLLSNLLFDYPEAMFFINATDKVSSLCRTE